MTVQDLSPGELEICALLCRGPRCIWIRQHICFIKLYPDESGNVIMAVDKVIFEVFPGIVTSLLAKGLLLTRIQSSYGKLELPYCYLVPDEVFPEFFKELKIQVALGSL